MKIKASRFLVRKIKSLTFHHFLLIGIFILFVFLRFWDIEGRMQFTWDQVQNAWVMKDMLVDHKMPLTGMIAKVNSGFAVGPAYYYLLAPFYWIFQLDPIAAGVFAGVVSTVTFIVFYFVARALFSEAFALIGSFLYTISFYSIAADRIPWPVVVIPLVSIAAFYFLYRTLMGDFKNIPWFALVVGFSFHIHFTAIFYIAIFMCVLPILLKRKIPWKYYGLSLLLFSVWFIPNIVSYIMYPLQRGPSPMAYLATYYHGVHAVRILQLLGDAHIELEQILFFKQIKTLAFIVLPFFVLLYYRKNPSKKSLIFIYLIYLWFTVPLFVLSTYGGEISNYYFRITRPIGILAFSYLFWFFWTRQNRFLRGIIFLIFLYYAYSNLSIFFESKYSMLPKLRLQAKQAVADRHPGMFQEGAPEPYMYYLYSRSSTK